MRVIVHSFLSHPPHIYISCDRLEICETDIHLIIDQNNMRRDVLNTEYILKDSETKIEKITVKFITNIKGIVKQRTSELIIIMTVSDGSFKKGNC